MTQGSPPVRPRFAGCHVPVDPAHRRVRQRCLSEAGRIRGPSPGPCRRYSILVIICCVCRTLLRRLASEEMTAPACSPQLGPFPFVRGSRTHRFVERFSSGGYMRDKEPNKRIQALKSKKKQTATMKRRALKPKNTKQSMSRFLARVQVEPDRAPEL